MTATSATSSNALPADFLASVNPKTTTTSDMQVSEDRFLKLLTTQLKNQDPLNPMDNAEMTSQLAQISTVTGIEKLNTTLEKLMSNSSDTQAVEAAMMLGRQVLVAGDSMTLPQDGQAVGGIEFPQAVDNASIAVRDANGLLVRTIPLGPQDSGLVDFVWDGKTDAGEQAAAGTYRFTVSAKQGGDAVEATTLALAEVTGVLRSGSEVKLELGQFGNFAMADIKQIY